MNDNDGRQGIAMGKRALRGFWKYKVVRIEKLNAAVRG
jgi:hypothetical protein